MAQQKLTSILKRLETLDGIPTLPIVASQVNDLINNPHSSASDIAEVLKQDQALTAKVLKLVNSPYYGVPGGVTSVQRALTFLGFNTVAQIVLSVSVLSLFPQESTRSSFSIPAFWTHSLATAITAGVIARTVKHPRPDEAFTCGLLHDIGKMVIHQIAPEILTDTIDLAKKNSISFLEAEMELGLPTHTQIGRKTAELWGLPIVIQECIYRHHDSIKNNNDLNRNIIASIQMTALANNICLSQNHGHSGDYSLEIHTDEFGKALGIDNSNYDQILIRSREELEKASAFFRT